MAPSAFHKLRRQRQRLTAITRLAQKHDRSDLLTLAQSYSVRLHGWAAMCRPADAGYLAGILGRNGIEPAIDDLSCSIKRARHLSRRISQNVVFLKSEGCLMPTVAREIDALGGTFDGYSDDRGGQYAPAYIDGYNRGHLNALDAAEPIAENADALIEELIELVEDVLDGARSLDRWVPEARLLITRAKHRRAQ